MKTPSNLSKWYNSTFYEDGKIKETVVGITIKHENGELNIPGIKVQATNSIHDIVAAFYGHLQSLPREVEEITEKPKTEEVKPPVDVGTTSYRGNNYIVEETDEDVFVVMRPDKSILSAKSPTAKAIVKKYKKENKG